MPTPRYSADGPWGAEHVIAVQGTQPGLGSPSMFDWVFTNEFAALGIPPAEAVIFANFIESKIGEWDLRSDNTVLISHSQSEASVDHAGFMMRLPTISINGMGTNDALSHAYPSQGDVPHIGFSTQGIGMFGFDAVSPFVIHI
jgi:hypothetical protein